MTARPTLRERERALNECPADKKNQKLGEKGKQVDTHWDTHITHTTQMQTHIHSVYFLYKIYFVSSFWLFIKLNIYIINLWQIVSFKFVHFHEILESTKEKAFVVVYCHTPHPHTHPTQPDRFLTRIRLTVVSRLHFWHLRKSCTDSTRRRRCSHRTHMCHTNTHKEPSANQNWKSWSS